MNVQCPNCATTFRVDPAKVPERGVRARCSVCAAVFPVRRGEEAASAEARPAVRAEAPAPAPPPAAVVAAPAMAAPAAPAPPPPAPPPGPPPQVAAQSAATLATPAMPGARPPQPRPGMTTPVPGPAVPPRPGTGGRPVNPFLSQDPGQKARRLARALVSDMVVYHPAKRRDALKAGTIKESFKEEITKSWEEYVEQVGRELAESTPFFREALNEILGDGKPVF
jgi:predicted Zn finger-like uncharacterized protein